MPDISPADDPLPQASAAWTSLRARLSGITDQPPHRIVADDLRERIASGELSSGQRLPAERPLALAVGISRMTLRRAIELLEASGHVVRTPGTRGGVRVSGPRSSVDITDMAGLGAQLLRSARRVTSQVLEAQTRGPDAETASALRLEPGELVHHVVRVRIADDVPVVLERSSFPATLFPDLLDHDLDGSIYALLRDHYGSAPTVASQELAARLPDPADAGLLDLPAEEPVLGVTRTASTARGVAVEFSRDLFRSDLLRITVNGRL
ncbi:GntR family transcriptional regulator [Kineosporia babensis]|uniref:GntR family transcriptional regulator n=1 Tax=Kineosporia babensis TaxID=499548 RepID=A0A9X1NIV0_9ACTN|nr:GntR family transcriptional regulator [Kineosporia babensis]MCD5314963.1 GntR family transcriptional regulator [Kineosporia babensis]